MPADVYRQSYVTENENRQDLQKKDRDNCDVKELNSRKKANRRPVAKMAAIIVSGRNLHEVHESVLNLTRSSPNINNVDIYGPAHDPL